jgi:hypothetical protein
MIKRWARKCCFVRRDLDNQSAVTTRNVFAATIAFHSRRQIAVDLSIRSNHYTVLPSREFARIKTNINRARCLKKPIENHSGGPLIKPSRCWTILFASVFSLPFIVRHHDEICETRNLTHSFPLFKIMSNINAVTTSTPGRKSITAIGLLYVSDLDNISRN